MKRGVWYHLSALAAGAVLAVAITFAFPHIVDPYGRLRAAERTRQVRVAAVRALRQAAEAEEAGGSFRQEVDGRGSLRWERVLPSPE
ncbi:MAG: hypothetical protein RLZZ536_786 [Planctomycetota bacterium]|jgi:hypothetical protein